MVDIGVCYYPEHVTANQWVSDSQKIYDLGITTVRIAEFSWSKIEPHDGEYSWEWLDECISIIFQQNLKVILCTPSAAPPPWLAIKYPQILLQNIEGRSMKSGSRRFVNLSSKIWQEETSRIVTLMAERFGLNPAIIGWQIDNELGWGGSSYDFGSETLSAFHNYLVTKYKEIKYLNDAWSSFFWGQNYNSFAEISLPPHVFQNSNPMHQMDYMQFISCETAKFISIQVNILRKFSPNRFITHNFMGFWEDFNVFKLAQELDIPGWDNYPTGHTGVAKFLTKNEKIEWCKNGHPDIAAFNHDFYRGIGKGKYFILEQQPGSINWGTVNMIPSPGMVKLWGWEAFSHGAQLVSFFSWRQFNFGTEQNHSALLTPDGDLSQGGKEVKQLAQELNLINIDKEELADIAILFDWDNLCYFSIMPNSVHYNYYAIIFDYYRALRKLGLNIDFIFEHSDINKYKMIVIPVQAYISNDFGEKLQSYSGVTIFGCRSGSMTANFGIPHYNTSEFIQTMTGVTVIERESFYSQYKEQFIMNGHNYNVSYWRDKVIVDKDTKVLASFVDNYPVITKKNNVYYLAGNISKLALIDFFRELFIQYNINFTFLNDDLRMRTNGNSVFLFNYGVKEIELDPQIYKVCLLTGACKIKPAGVYIYNK